MPHTQPDSAPRYAIGAESLMASGRPEVSRSLPNAGSFPVFPEVKHTLSHRSITSHRRVEREIEGRWTNMTGMYSRNGALSRGLL